jgi:organic hydroperoxide reductase OsmC/OhrA
MAAKRRAWVDRERHISTLCRVMLVQRRGGRNDPKEHDRVERRRSHGEGFAITSIALDLEARVDGLGVEQFRTLAEAAKKNCPVSKALSATPISLTTRLA